MSFEFEKFSSKSWYINYNFLNYFKKFGCKLTYLVLLFTNGHTVTLFLMIQKKRQSRGGVKAKKAKIKISSGSKNNTSNTLTNNNDTGNNSNNNTWELGMEGLPTGSQEDYNADLNNNSMLSNTSKYYCNLCTSSYKHFCNLLTHEVKVHGRQKKRGGRKRKSDALVVYDADNKAPTGDNNHSLGGAEEFDGGGGYGNEAIDNEEVEGCSEEVMKGGAEGVLVEEA